MSSLPAQSDYEPGCPLGYISDESRARLAGAIFLTETNPLTNKTLGSEVGGQGICSEISTLLTAVTSYREGHGVAYAPLRNVSNTFNSTASPITLLHDIGAAATFQPGIGWSPGWGQLVPGLHCSPPKISRRYGRALSQDWQRTSAPLIYLGDRARRAARR
jgi:hypothetical protein